jgi:hypothetical protein
VANAGRPTKLDPEIADRFIRAIRKGAFRSVAAVWAGIGVRTFREWMVRGKEEPEFADFRRMVMEAERAAEIEVGETAFAAAAADPEYALAYMRVRWRKRWDPAKKLELTGKDGAPLGGLTDEQLETKYRALRDKIAKEEAAPAETER